MDPDNYRGIIISSCVGKIYLKIFTKRIEDYMKNSGQWKINQCGFKKDHRTEDNLFVVNTIFNSYVNEKAGGKVYIAFVDFSKYFDSINRQLLFYKLMRCGITGQLYNIIKSMYSNTMYRVKIKDQFSPSFSAKHGVKQGCCMSPLLSNLYQNDLHNIFSEDCDPVTLDDITLNSISWADDLLLISKSKEGLQKCLDKLHSYCKTWGLDVNVTKTKTMVMSKKQWAPESFTYGQLSLECVKIFKYLGFLISFDGNFKHMITDRIEKAQKMANMALRAIRTNKTVSLKLAMSIFDKQILPILLYGCSIWSLPGTHNLLYLHEQSENVQTRTCVNKVLTEIMGKPVPFIYARRIGKKDPLTPRKILIKFSTYSDKLKLFSMSHNKFIFSNYVDNNSSTIEKVHLNFMKQTLNITKYSSNKAIYKEMGRFPITHTALRLVTKYWERAKTGTENTLFNAAFKISTQENHQWIQGVQNLFTSNGLAHLFQTPTREENVIPNIVKQRLNDQFIQDLESDIRGSSRLKHLISFNGSLNSFQRSTYLNTIKNPDIRLIFTRLRIDINILSTCKIRKQVLDMCPLCNNESETVKHFITKCSYFKTEREAFLNIIKPYIDKDTWTDDTMLNFILNLDCPPECIGICCKYLEKIYKKRENVLE